MVEAARIAYRDYPTVVNDIPESGLTYKNEPHEYARMDSTMQQAQRAIGGSSDSAQLAQSYMWSKVAKNEFDDEYTDLYHNTVILAVLAQCSIDSIKREYAVNPNDEIARIRSMDCMNRKKDYPLFMKYTHEIPVTKNGKERPYEDIKKDKKKIERRIDKNIVCPMNYLQSHLDKIQGAVRSEAIDTYQFFKKIDGSANHKQMSKIRTIIEDYDRFIRNSILYIDDDEDSFDIITSKTQEVLEQIGRMRIALPTMNRLIETCLGVMGKANTDKQYNEATKYISRTFNLLYQVDKERFLSNFVHGEDKNFPSIGGNYTDKTQ